MTPRQGTDVIAGPPAPPETQDFSAGSVGGRIVVADVVVALAGVADDDEDGEHDDDDRFAIIVFALRMTMVKHAFGDDDGHSCACGGDAGGGGQTIWPALSFTPESET